MPVTETFYTSFSRQICLSFPGGARTILVVDEVGIERRGGDRGADVDHVEVFGLLEIGPDDVALRPLELEGEVERAEHGDHEDGDDERRYRLAESRSSHT